jgi:hypothetical protein
MKNMGRVTEAAASKIDRRIGNPQKFEASASKKTLMDEVERWPLQRFPITCVTVSRSPPVRN